MYILVHLFVMEKKEEKKLCIVVQCNKKENGLIVIEKGKIMPPARFNFQASSWRKGQLTPHRSYWSELVANWFAKYFVND